MDIQETAEEAELSLARGAIYFVVGSLQGERTLAGHTVHVLTQLLFDFTRCSPS